MKMYKFKAWNWRAGFKCNYQFEPKCFYYYKPFPSAYYAAKYADRFCGKGPYTVIFLAGEEV